MRDIRDWLEALGLGDYVQSFVENDVDLGALPHLTEAMLREMGLSIGVRAKVMAGIEALRSASSAFGQSSSGGRTTGAALAYQLEPKAQRRQLTVMFCDLVGSTALAEAIDPEELRTLIGAYRRAAQRLVERYGGSVAQYLGDGVMAYFGWPVAHGDDAERAVRTALELVHELKSVGALHTIQVRIGVATGLVVIGEGAEGDPTLAVGETPNLASRLQSLAGIDEVMISETTSRLLGNVFELMDAGLHPLKGFAEPVRVKRVVGLARAAGRFERKVEGLVPFVGREPELGLLLDRWADAQEGEGQIVLVEGEAGFGKSRLISEFLKRIDGQRYGREHYQCSAFHMNSALHPVIEQLEHAAGIEPTDDGVTRLDKLEALVPDVGQTRALFAALLSLDTRRYPALDLNAQKQHALTLQALVDRLRTQAQSGPILLIVEDAHWLDPTTREALDAQFSAIVGLPVLAIVTFWPEFQPPWLDLVQVTPLRLTRLSKRYAMEMVQKAAPDLSDQLHQKIVAATDGIPLFVEEVTSTVRESDMREREARPAGTHAHADSIAIPLTLHDSLNARLDQLGPLKELAQVAACIGRRFSRTLLSRIAPSQYTDLDAALASLIESGLVYQERIGDDEHFRFKHALIQQSAHAGLLNRTRRAIHARVADALIEQHGLNRRADFLEIAQHLRAAQRIAEALAWFRRAAAHAAQAGSVQESMQILDQALVLLEETPGAPEERDRAELDLLTAKLPVFRAVRGWASDEADTIASRALELAAALDDKPNQISILFQLATMCEVRGEFDKTQQVLARSDQILPRSSDVTLLIESSELMACSTFHQGRFEVSIEHAKQALGIADSNDHIDTHATQLEDPVVASLFWIAKSLLLQGRIDQARDASRQAFEFVNRLPKWYSESQADIAAASLFAYLRDFERVLYHSDRAMTSAARVGLPYREASAKLINQWGKVMTGNRAPEIETIEASLSEFRRVGAMIDYAFYLSLAAEVHGCIGAYEKCDELVEQALEKCGAHRGYFFEAELHRIAGEYAQDRTPARTQAQARYQQALQIAREQGALLFELRAATALARLWFEEGRMKAACDLLAPLYVRCPEGRDSADLVAAAELLEAVR